jgi:hypothetical protein
MLKIIKRDITETSRQLSVGWTLGCEILDEPKIDISKLTTEEQADLIIKKLREPPKSKLTTEEHMMLILTAEIAAEMDREILETIKKGFAK